MKTRQNKTTRRVLIVGAKFGEIYMNAFLQPLPGLQLAGLLARGSHRARQLAHDFGVPLYTDLEQLPDDIDIACVVVRSTVARGSGTQLAVGLLQRGIHVVQEHPLHPDDIARLQALADAHGVTYLVNSFYACLSAGRGWIERAARIRHLLGGLKPCAAYLTTSRQFLYSALDLLLQACGVVNGEPVQVEGGQVENDCFTSLRLVLPEDCRVTLHLQSCLDPSDPDMFSLVMNQASLIWNSGCLTLESAYGPVIWTGVFHDRDHADRDNTLYRHDDNTGCYAQPTSMILQQAPACWRDAFEMEGPDSVGHLLDELCHMLDGATPPQARPAGLGAAHQLALARLWLDVLHMAPPIIERKFSAPRLITRQELDGDSAPPEAARG